MRPAITFLNIQLSNSRVPGYYLVCYNYNHEGFYREYAVVPGYYLVCYNSSDKNDVNLNAVVPGYYLVCYNS